MIDNNELSIIIDDLLNSDEFKHRVMRDSAIIKDYVIAKIINLAKSKVTVETCREIIIEILEIKNSRKNILHLIE